MADDNIEAKRRIIENEDGEKFYQCTKSGYCNVHHCEEEAGRIDQMVIFDLQGWGTGLLM